MLSIEELRKLAELARIDVPDSELEELRGQLGTILDYVAQIQTADTEGVPDAKDSLPTLRNVFREDTLPHETGMYTAEIMANMPASEGGYLKVKKILEK